MGAIRAFGTGQVLPDTAHFGTLDSLPNVALASFRLLVDWQAYPLYARGAAAIALRRYLQAIAQAESNRQLTVTVELELLAVGQGLLAFASKIHWHVFGELRGAAEKEITADKHYLFDSFGLPPDWPRAPLANFADTSQETQL